MCGYQNHTAPKYVYGISIFFLLLSHTYFNVCCKTVGAQTEKVTKAIVRCSSINQGCHAYYKARSKECARPSTKGYVKAFFFRAAAHEISFMSNTVIHTSIPITWVCYLVLISRRIRYNFPSGISIPCITTVRLIGISTHILTKTFNNRLSSLGLFTKTCVSIPKLICFYQFAH